MRDSTTCQYIRDSKLIGNTHVRLNLTVGSADDTAQSELAKATREGKGVP